MRSLILGCLFGICLRIHLINFPLDCFTKPKQNTAECDLAHNLWDVYMPKYEHLKHLKYKYPQCTCVEHWKKPIWFVSAVIVYNNNAAFTMLFSRIDYIDGIWPVLINTTKSHHQLFIINTLLVMESIDRVLISHNPAPSVHRDSHNLWIIYQLSSGGLLRTSSGIFLIILLLPLYRRWPCSRGIIVIGAKHYTGCYCGLARHAHQRPGRGHYCIPLYVAIDRDVYFTILTIHIEYTSH